MLIRFHYYVNFLCYFVEFRERSVVSCGVRHTGGYIWLVYDNEVTIHERYKKKIFFVGCWGCSSSSRSSGRKQILRNCYSLLTFLQAHAAAKKSTSSHVFYSLDKCKFFQSRFLTKQLKRELNFYRIEFWLSFNSLYTIDRLGASRREEGGRYNSEIKIQNIHNHR